MLIAYNMSLITTSVVYIHELFLQPYYNSTTDTSKLLLQLLLPLILLLLLKLETTDTTAVD